MKHMRLSKILLGLTATVLISSGLVVARVNAQATNANSTQGIQISPPFVELNVTRGTTYNIPLSITNITAADLVYSTSMADFNAADETGSPHIILDSQLPAIASIKTWVTTLAQFTLPAHKSIVVVAQIVVPTDAEPGGHYGVLNFSLAAPELESNSVGLSASAGVLILIRVDGIITEKASLVSFHTAQNDKQSSFFENGPITFVTRIKNDGNIHVKPSGNIEVHDMFGGLVATYEVNKQEPMSNVLPDSIRRFDLEFDKPWLIGRYTASLTLGYGTTGQAITSTITFWVIPWKIILVGLLALATLIFVLGRLIKVYNRHIIEKSKDENIDKNKKHKKEKHKDKS
jgi:hypothetical protein